VWLVDCEESQQLARLMARDQFSEADARARIGAQWPLARKRGLADVVIDNSRAAADLADQVALALAGSVTTSQKPC
jgi:dephospho-CoA kinase